MTSTQNVSHLGGSMYGDGDYVVQFENVDSSQAPMSATVMFFDALGCDQWYEIKNLQSKRPSVKLAAYVIGLARRENQRRGVTLRSEVAV